MERGVVIFAVLFLSLSLSAANGEFQLRSLPDQCSNSILGGEHVLFKRIVLLAFFVSSDLSKFDFVSNW